jgi:hypothetical protein
VFVTKGVKRDAEDKIGQQIADPAAAVGNIQVYIGQIYVETFTRDGNAKRLYQRYCGRRLWPGASIRPVGCIRLPVEELQRDL